MFIHHKLVGKKQQSNSKQNNLYDVHANVKKRYATTM